MRIDLDPIAVDQIPDYDDFVEWGHPLDDRLAEWINEYIELPHDPMHPDQDREGVWIAKYRDPESKWGRRPDANGWYIFSNYEYFPTRYVHAGPFRTKMEAIDATDWIMTDFKVYTQGYI